MTLRHLTIALALLPCSAAVPGCDAADKHTSATNIAGDSEASETGAAEDSDSSDGATEGATEAAATEAATEAETDDAGTTTPAEPPPPPEPRPQPVVPCDEDDGWFGTSCTLDGDIEGSSFCIVVDGEQVQTPCYPNDDIPCHPGDSLDQGCLGYLCAWDGADLYYYDWEEPDCDTPLVVDFEGGSLRFDAAGAAAFDLMGASECAATDWPTLPWLALDRDGDGAISDGRELFGSGTLMATGDRASDGFQALAELDADRDGRLTIADPAFADLVLWSDRDDNRRGELAELLPVRDANLVAIDLAYASRIECDARGNCGRERARFEFRAPTGELRSGEIVDVYLACQ